MITLKVRLVSTHVCTYVYEYILTLCVHLELAELGSRQLQSDPR